MKTYAFVVNGEVQEIIHPAVYVQPDPALEQQLGPDVWVILVTRVGQEIPIEERYHPDFVARMVEITGLDPQPQANWTYINGVFAPYVAPPPTPEEVLASQSAKLQSLTQLANAQKLALTNRISTINDAIELEMATLEEETELPKRVLQLKAWKTYAVLLGRVTSQVGWPPDVEWPAQPLEGMDLTVSANPPQTV